MNNIDNIFELIRWIDTNIDGEHFNDRLKNYFTYCTENNIPIESSPQLRLQDQFLNPPPFEVDESTLG
jgi:hypothetical protein